MFLALHDFEAFLRVVLIDFDTQLTPKTLRSVVIHAYFAMSMEVSNSREDCVPVRPTEMYWCSQAFDGFPTCVYTAGHATHAIVRLSYARDILLKLVICIENP